MHLQPRPGGCALSPFRVGVGTSFLGGGNHPGSPPVVTEREVIIYAEGAALSGCALWRWLVLAIPVQASRSAAPESGVGGEPVWGFLH